jgi:pimeloyl-ACP methyl ester carboxylesterase
MSWVDSGTLVMCSSIWVMDVRELPQTSALDARTLAGDFAVPVFVIHGAEDFTTPTSLARSFVDSIRAPAKAFVPIEGGGHFAVFMKSSAFLDQLVSRVLPVARRPDGI